MRRDERTEIGVLDAISRRVSVRAYASRVVEPDLVDRLLGLSRAIDPLTASSPRIALVSGQESTRRVLTYLIGSYGLVVNPPHLLVGVLPEESEAARLDLGYVLEHVVLEATRVGLGTCWIAGSYDAQRAGDAVGLAVNEVTAAVCAVGYPVERGWGRFHNRAIHWLARGHRRKPLEQIVFQNHWGEAWSRDGTDPVLVTALKQARLAPSAVNRQPWFFVFRPDCVVLGLSRPAHIDAGIAMAHFALACSALGRAGQWEVRLNDPALRRECRMPEAAIPVATYRC